MDEILNNACLDSNDERNYQYEQIMWSSEELPSKVLLETGFRQNQQADGYPYGCVYFARAEASNYLSKSRLQWKDFIKWSSTRKEWVWDYVINWTKLLNKQNIISWYALVKTLNEVKHSLANGRPIHTGSNKIDWTKTKNNNWYAVYSDSYWHSFHIIGYDDAINSLICKNSYWPNYIAKGNFYINYELFDKVLMNSKFSLIANPTLIDNYKQKIMEWITLDSAKIAFLLWIYNWDKRNEETRAIMLRAIEWMLNWKITKESIEKARKELQK